MSGGAGVRRAIAVALIVTGLARAGLAAAGAVAGATTSQQVSGGSYGEFTGLTPARVLDARHGLGPPSGQPEWMTSGDTMDVQIGGRGGVPANGVTAVVLTSHLCAAPYGPAARRTTRPEAATERGASRMVQGCGAQRPGRGCHYPLRGGLHPCRARPEWAEWPYARWVDLGLSC